MKYRMLRKYIHKYVMLIILLFLSADLIACKSNNISVNDEHVVSQYAAEDEALESKGNGDKISEGKATEGKAAEDKTAGLTISPAEKDSSSSQGVEETQTNEAVTDREAMAEAYKSALRGVCDDHIFPDGQPCDWLGQGELTQNQFAVYDIDQDSKDELTIVYTTASMAGMIELIYDFDEDTKTLEEEIREFPALTCYDNGIILADWSHNQGLAGDFWPYTLYQYDNNSDCYVNIGMVDAWDRSLSETDYDGNQFPSDIDTDGDEIVYYIMKDGNYELVDPIDGIDYKKWIDSYVGNAKEVNIPFMSLSDENIDNLQ